MGHKKENWYLKALCKNNDEYHKIFDAMWHGANYKKRRNDHAFGEYLSRSNRFIKNTSLDMLMVNPKSIDAYIEYFLGHWENIKDEYQGVCDFSNTNFTLPRHFLYSIAPKLQEHFKVKVLMEFRDPVRRYFSEVGHLLDPKRKVLNAFQGDFIASRFCARREHRKLFFWNLKQDRVPDHCDYIEGYLKYCDVFGKENVYPVIMEDFWNPDKEKEELERISEFFEYEITKMSTSQTWEARHLTTITSKTSGLVTLRTLLMRMSTSQACIWAGSTKIGRTSSEKYQKHGENRVLSSQHHDFEHVCQVMSR